MTTDDACLWDMNDLIRDNRFSQTGKECSVKTLTVSNTAHVNRIYDNVKTQVNRSGNMKRTEAL